jgi:preprotein translocase subunit SecG
MTFVYYLTMSLLVFVAVLLILAILIQKGRGGGISSAFGGGGGSSAFGAKTGDVLTWATAIIFGVFLILGVTLDLIVQHEFPSTSQTSSAREPAGPAPVMPAPVMPATNMPNSSTTPPGNSMPPVSSTPSMPTISLPTTQPITNAANQVIQTGKNDVTGLIKAATQQAAPVLNHK